MFKKKKRLLWKLYPSYLLITLLSIATVSWYASKSLNGFYLEQVATDLKARGILLVKIFFPPQESPDPAKVDSICKEIGPPSKTRITVVSASGVVLGDSVENPAQMENHRLRPEIIEALNGGVGQSIRFSATLEMEMMYVAIPAKTGNHVLGVVRTALPVNAIHDLYGFLRSRILWGMVIIAILATGISFLVSRKITRPIEEIKQGAEKFAQGDLSYRLHLPDSEEIGSLALSMNRMAGQLDDRIRAVIQHRNELEAVLSSMMEGVIAIDLDEKIISINQAASVMFLKDPWEMEGRSIQEMIRNSELQKFVRQALNEGQSVACDVTLNQDPERIAHVHSSPLLDSSEKRIGLLVVLNDVTQLRRLENMRQDFVANVSHEIKTPLTAIQGFVETLLQDAEEFPEQGMKFLKIIEKHVFRLVAIIEDLLNLSRIEREDSGKEIKLEKGPIKDIILTAIDICRPKAVEKEIKIVLQCEKDLYAGIDPPLMEQAVVNLLDNAIKYSPPKNKIWVKAVGGKNGIEIQVKDEGMGIPKEHVPRLFERFYRVDKARSRKLGGTGLGLAIVKHIIQAHHGRVTVDSKPGKGSKFTLHLPNIKKHDH